jgi:hypothetical protein
MFLSDTLSPAYTVVPASLMASGCARRDIYFYSVAKSVPAYTPVHSYIFQILLIVVEYMQQPVRSINTKWKWSKVACLFSPNYIHGWSLQKRDLACWWWVSRLYLLRDLYKNVLRDFLCAWCSFPILKWLCVLLPYASVSLNVKFFTAICGHVIFIGLYWWW